MQAGILALAAPLPICWPWPLGQRERPSPAPSALEKQASATTRPFKKGCWASTPLSIITTAAPAPSLPAVQTAGIPITVVLLANEATRNLSSLMLKTSAAFCKAVSAAASTLSAKKGMVLYLA